jgi:hypothetical protein
MGIAALNPSYGLSIDRGKYVGICWDMFQPRLPNKSLRENKKERNDGNGNADILEV